MFLDRFQVDEVIKGDYETIENTMELIYSVLFHPIFPFMDLGTREGWASLSLSLSLYKGS